jgi:hypothetical protein
MTDMNQILNDYLDNLFNEYEQEQALPQDTWDDGITDEQ